MIKKIFRRFLAANAAKLWIAAVLLTFAHTGLAQDLATVSGTVTDQNGAVVAGATVTLSSAALSIERTTTTSEDGTYSIPQVRPGLYVITVGQTSFQTSRADDFQIGAAQSRNFDVTLLPGEASATITITSGDEPATLDQSSARLGTNLTAREVQDLPVNGRTYTQLYINAPGATNTGTGNANEIRFNGRSNEQNQVRYDGVEATAIFDASPGYTTVQGSQFRLQASLETVQEFRVDSSNYPAEQGTGTGGQINLVSKTGTNSFRGSLFEYFRNDALDARNFFDAAEPSILRLNQFGGSIGGPIAKDRVFFFGNYEGLRQRSGVNFIELTPSTLARQFIASGGTDATAAAALGLTGANFGNVAALRDSGVLSAFPIGTGALVNLGTVPNGAQFAQLNSVLRLEEDVFNARIDAKVTDRFNFYLRLNAPQGDLIAPDGTTGRNILVTQKPRNFVGSLSQTYGTNIFNETKIGINKSPTTLSTQVPTSGSALNLSTASLRLGGTVVSPGVNGGASTGLAEPGGLTRQSSAGNGRAQPINGISYSVIDNLAVVTGNHSFKFGGEIRFNEVKFDQLGGTTVSYGSLRDFLLNQAVTAAFIGDLSAPGDFRVATNPVTTFSRPFEGLSTAKNRFYIAYGQDEWKIRENLTVSYGLRYEYYTPVRERDNRVIVFDAATNRVVDSTEDFYQSKKNNFGPRVGITYAPKFLGGKTVFRAGGGIYYGPGQFEDLIQPIESNVLRSNLTITGATLNASTIGTINGAVSAITNPLTPLGVQQNFTPRAYDVNGYNVPERVGQYSFSVQQELPSNTVLTVAYVGSQGRNLFQRSIANRILLNTNPNGCDVVGATPVLPTGCGVINRRAVAGGPVVQSLTIRETTLLNTAVNGASGAFTVSNGAIVNPFGEIDYKLSGGRDRYDALQLQVQRRFSSGLALGGQYAYSKSRGNSQGSNEAVTVQNPFSFDEEFGRNNFDIRHSANLTALYELPIGNDKALNLGSVGNYLFGGLQIGGIYNGRSGVPLNILVTRADTAIVCQQTGGCPTSYTIVNNLVVPSAGTTFIPQGTVARAGTLPAGFVTVINTPGGNASRSTRRPNLVAGVDPFLSGNGADKTQFLNPAAFSIPTPGTYGNYGRNQLSGPNFHQFDLTLQKRFRIAETANIEFRTEVFNVFNKANFANPPILLGENLPQVALSTTAGVTTAALSGGLQPNQPFSFNQSANFGRINSTVGRTVGLGTNRQIQFALRLNF